MRLLGPCISLVLLHLFSCGALAQDGESDEDLKPSAKTGAEVQSLLKSGVTTDELHKQLQTTPALVRKNRFHWQLADGSLMTDVVATNEGQRVIGWYIKSESLNAEGGELGELDQLLSRYYQAPEPAKIPRFIELASRCGIFEEEHSRMPIAFLSLVFRQNPDHLNEWLESTESLPDPHKQVVYKALWEADTPESKQLLQEIAESDQQNSEFVEALRQREPVDLLERAIDDPGDLDALWVAFFATGDRRYVERICSVFSWDMGGPDRNIEKRLIRGAAVWSVGSNARRHPRVLEICKTLAATADDRAKPILDRILTEIQK